MRSKDLHCCTSYHCPCTKFLISLQQLCDIFLKTFYWLPFKLTYQNVRPVGGRVFKHDVGFSTNDNSASHCPCNLIGQMQQKPSESCRKDVTKLSQSKRKLCTLAMAIVRSTNDHQRESSPS